MAEHSAKEAYRRFLNTRHGADVYREFKRILYTDGDSLVRRLNRQVFEPARLARRTPLRVCDIGGGDGDRALRIVRFLADMFGARVELDFVEQSEPYLEDFRNRQPGTLCEAHIHQGLFEHAALEPGAYDLVLLIHSIFAFENEDAVDRVLSLPSSTGKIVVVANATSSLLGGLKRLVDEDFDDRRYEVDDLRRSLRKRDVRFGEIRFTTEWAIDHANWERDAGTLLDWISLGRFETFAPARRRAILAYIDSRSRQQRDRRVFAEEEVVLVI